VKTRALGILIFEKTAIAAKLIPRLAEHRMHHIRRVLFFAGFQAFLHKRHQPDFLLDGKFADGGKSFIDLVGRTEGEEAVQLGLGWIARRGTDARQRTAVNRTGGLKIADHVGRLDHAEPVGGQPLRLILDRNGAPPPVNFPVGVNLYLGRVARDLLALKRVEELAEAIGPAANEIDVLKFSDAEHLLEGLEPQREDEFRVRQFLREVKGDADFLLDVVTCERAVAAAQQHLNGARLKRGGDQLPPPVAGFKRHNVGKDSVARSLQARREPERKFVVAWRGFADKDHRAIDRCTGGGKAHFFDAGRTHQVEARFDNSIHSNPTRLSVRT
jgi:hypothetical protein